jgi:nitrite reductase/ring-hydroxylating ferredoxin subunit
MSGEDQERVEDYLELEHFIEELQAGRAAHPPDGLTPSKARIYRMAALFRSASPDEATPRPEFAAELHAKLEQELQRSPKTRRLPFLSKKPQMRPRVSRRALLAGGATAVAASLAAGAGIEYVIEHATTAGTPPQAWNNRLLPMASIWHPVTTLAELGNDPLFFFVNSIAGFVIRNDGDGDAGTNDPVIAISAACTDQSCILQWQKADQKYLCPCHGALFTEYGKVDKNTPPVYSKLPPLPRLDVRVVGDQVLVRVPALQTSKK